MTPDRTNATGEPCRLCGGRGVADAFALAEWTVVECAACGLQRLDPQPDDDALRAVYGRHYALGSGSEEGRAQSSRLKRATARRYLRELALYRGSEGGRLLELGSGEGDFLHEARAAGYDAAGIELREAAGSAPDVAHGRAEDLLPGRGPFDVVALWDVLEHARDPVRLLEAVAAELRRDSVLALATPSRDSWSARGLGRRWMEYKPEHLFYFDRSTLESLLFRCGFDRIVLRPNRKVLSAAYVAAHCERYPVAGLTPLVRLGARALPDRLRHRGVPVVASGVTAFARKAEPRARRRLSVVVPALDEAGTLPTVMERVLGKDLGGLDLEVVLVESGSTDGTRAIARSYARHPQVRLVEQDRPRGKGHAVRAGFAQATGDFVLVQDADLEYEVEDYDALLAPLRSGERAFVLGARHGGRGALRVFTDQPLLALVLNAGHWLFAGLVNLLFRVRLRDPFTMYKVFRRDCLFGLDFRCDRFDFDFELLAKLVRKGYRPLEVPVRYRSRSFREGKKVSLWRDPPSWLRALVYLRLCRVDPLGWVVRQRGRSRRPGEAAPQTSTLTP